MRHWLLVAALSTGCFSITEADHARRRARQHSERSACTRNALWPALDATTAVALVAGGAYAMHWASGPSPEQDQGTIVYVAGVFALLAATVPAVSAIYGVSEVRGCRAPA